MLIGIVAKPNTGKSTLFKALTLADVLIANYPFATIAPNHGIGFVKVDCVDTFFNTQCNPREGFCIEHKRFIPVELIDVAGLVPGAHEGKGMGNQFLDDLNQADCLIHVIDISGSTNEKGEQVATGSYNPENDIKFLETELDYWYLRILKKGWEKFSRQIMQEHKKIEIELAKQLSGLRVNEDIAKQAIKNLKLNPDKPAEWSEDELLTLASELRKKTKPIIIAANKIDVRGAKEKYEQLKKDFPNYIIIPCSAESELALKEAAKKQLINYIPGENHFEIIDERKVSEQQRKALDFIQKNILEPFETTGAQTVLNTAVFDMLKYIAIFPGGLHKLEDQYGRKLPDCFLMPPGTTALDFAYKLHSDLGDHFIRAIDVKKKLTVGKEHKLNHLDVIEIISGK
ncbi:MAG: redox-regulated ATPase YchF [Candidatus Woesearchaeota archaeon]